MMYYFLYIVRMYIATPQPQLPTRPPPPRGLARRQKNPPAHPRQPLPLAPRKNRNLPPPPPGRAPRLPARFIHHPPDPPPRPRRGHPAHDPQARTGSSARLSIVPGTGPGGRHDRAAADRSLLETGDHACLARQERIEQKLAARHLEEGGLVLYDVSSSYDEGRTCPLAQLGHDRDGQKGLPIIVYGVMTNGEGCPVAVEGYAGNTGDPTTVAEQIAKRRERFGLVRVVLVGDRGMLTQPQIDKLKLHPGWGWITALTSVAIRELVKQGALQLSLLDEKNLAEITSPEYPEERLMVCHNPLREQERKRQREALRAATEKNLEKIRREVERRKKKPLTADVIGVKVGKVLGRYKMGKHFRYEIGENHFTWSRHQESIEQEARLDGIYVLRTSEPAERLSAEDTVRSYKSLAEVERAFRCLKGVDLLVRPIRHRTEERVPAHIFLCLLAYYVEWHLRRAWATLLYEDEERWEERQRRDPVLPAQPSESAQRKKRTHQTADGLPLHSFHGLLQELASRARVTYALKSSTSREKSNLTFEQVPEPNPVQARAYDLIRAFSVARG